MTQPIVCAGAPRDLGLDQGRACAPRIAAEIEARLGGAWSRRLRPPDGVSRRVARDLQRFFPHQAERCAGLAAGARVGEREVAALLARELHARPGAAAVAAGAERTGGRALVAVTLGEPVCIHRRSEPDNDFASVELVAPWALAPFAGVNEHGLAAAFVGGAATPATLTRCAAPAALLVQDCIQRFDSLDAALEWCCSRPAGGVATLLLADAGGHVASVRVEGSERRVERGEAGLLLAAARDADREDLGKTLGEHPAPDGAALAAALLGATPDLRPVARVDPAARSVSLVRAGGAAQTSRL